MMSSLRLPLVVVMLFVPLVIRGMGTLHAQELNSCDQIAFVSRQTGTQQIFLMGIDGSNRVNLSSNQLQDFDPSWSPDGQQLAFTSNKSGNWDIWVMYADGTRRRKLTNRIRDDYSPSWSPDGKRIVFSSLTGTSNSNLFVMNSDGSDVVQVTSNTGLNFGAHWSPDGSKIAFHKSSANGDNPRIFVMNADGSDQQPLMKDEIYGYFPVWSPDGQSIVYWGNGIELVSANGTDREMLTPQVGFADDRWATWSPDGNFLIFSSNRDFKHYGLFTMRLDGTDYTHIPETGPADDSPVIWRPRTPSSNCSS